MILTEEVLAHISALLTLKRSNITQQQQKPKETQKHHTVYDVFLPIISMQSIGVSQYADLWYIISHRPSTVPIQRTHRSQVAQNVLATPILSSIHHLWLLWMEITSKCYVYFSVLFVPEQVTLIKVQLYNCIVVFNFNVSLESCQYIWKSIFGPSLFSGVKMCWLWVNTNRYFHPVVPNAAFSWTSSWTYEVGTSALAYWVMAGLCISHVHVLTDCCLCWMPEELQVWSSWSHRPSWCNRQQAAGVVLLFLGSCDMAGEQVTARWRRRYVNLTFLRVCTDFPPSDRSQKFLFFNGVAVFFVSCWCCRHRRTHQRVDVFDVMQQLFRNMFIT